MRAHEASRAGALPQGRPAGVRRRSRGPIGDRQRETPAIASPETGATSTSQAEAVSAAAVAGVQLRTDGLF